MGLDSRIHGKEGTAKRKVERESREAGLKKSCGRGEEEVGEEMLRKNGRKIGEGERDVRVGRKKNPFLEAKG